MGKFKCFAFLNSSVNDHHRDLVSKYGMDCGYANGYVAIPTDHPLYGKSYDEAYEAGITAHGGLTYSDSMPSVLSNFDLFGVDWLDVKCRKIIGCLALILCMLVIRSIFGISIAVPRR